MNRFEAWMVYVTTLLVGGTGLLYAAMLYALEPIDEFAVIHHPFQPHVQRAHIWFAPLLVFAVGLIWRQHVWKHFRSGRPRGRRTGVTLLAVLAPMVFSGYLLQTSVEPAWRTAWVVLHLATSAVFLAGFALHVAVLARARSKS